MTKVHMGVGFYPDGRVGELFVDLHKFGSALRDWIGTASVSFSALLQHGVSLKDVCSLYAGLVADPHGTVEGLSCIETCTSIMDAIARELSCVYADSAANLITLAAYAGRVTTAVRSQDQGNIGG